MGGDEGGAEKRRGEAICPCRDFACPVSLFALSLSARLVYQPRRLVATRPQIISEDDVEKSPISLLDAPDLEDIFNTMRDRHNHEEKIIAFMQAVEFLKEVLAPRRSPCANPRLLLVTFDCPDLALLA